MADRILIGKFGSPYGIQGWVKVISYTSPIEKLLAYLPWYTFRKGLKEVINPLKGKLHSGHLLVQLAGCHDRDQAKSFTNLDIYIERDQLPELGQEEYYWVDLIGLTVINCQEQYLGKVERLFETGSNDVLVTKEEDGKERYIPYIQDVILDVKLDEKKILVDWDADF